MKIWQVCLLVVVLAVAYSPMRNAGLVYEDWRWQEMADRTSYPLLAPAARPLTRLSWQMNTTALHATSLLFHAIAAVLVVVLLLQLGVPKQVALFGGAVFLLHRLQVEAVAYASGRSDVLATIGILVACIGGVRRRWAWVLLGTVIAFLSDLGSVSLIALVPTLWMRKPMLSALVVLAGIVYAVAGWLSLAPPLSWVFVQSAATMRLVGLALVPVGLAVDYDYSQIPQVFQVSAVALLVLWGFCAWSIRRDMQLVSLGAWWILACSIPRLLVHTPTSYFNEHQFYPAMIGFTMMVTGLGERSWQTNLRSEAVSSRSRWAWRTK